MVMDGYRGLWVVTVSLDIYHRRKGSQIYCDASFYAPKEY